MVTSNEILFTCVVILSTALVIQRIEIQQMKAYFRGRETFYKATVRNMKLALQRMLTSSNEEQLDLSMQQLVADLDDREF